MSSSSDPRCPHCGARIGEHDGLSQSTSPPRLDLRLGSSSGDSLPGSSNFVIPAGRVTPDPLLDALAAVAPTQDAVSVTTEFLVPTGEPSPVLPFAGEPIVPSGSFEAIERLNLDASPRPGRSAREDEVEEEIVYVSGPNWPMLLLSSYASAITLALVWWVVIPRFRGRSEIDGFVPGAPAASVGTRRADRSHKVAPAPAIAPEHMTRLGRPLKIGSLEFTPLEVSRQDVTLRRDSISGETEEREGGAGALALTIRVRNLAKDAVFAPLDETFLRDRDNGLSDSFVELGSGERVYLYPLPIESEWSIAGQEFPDLKPGEVKETHVVTSADFPSADSGMTWHLKLRTGLDSTDTIGVEIPAGK